MHKNAEKYKRHEMLTNNFLVQLAFIIASAIYTFILMNGSNTVESLLAVRFAERACFIVFAIVAVVLLFVWLKTGKKAHKSGFCYSIIFSFMNLYLAYYSRIASRVFGGYFNNIMTGEFKTLLTLIGIGGLACFAYYVIKDNMPYKKTK